MIYQVVPADQLLTQGDIIDACPIVRATEDGGTDQFQDRVIVMTQACDIVQTKADRVVVAVMYTAAEIVAQGELKGQAIRDQVRRGQVFGWYFLPAAPEPIPLPESIVNFRDLHTVSRLVGEIGGRGPASLPAGLPYREHLAQHFAVTYMRIALPEPYETRP